jgi:hypothetical protein
MNARRLALVAAGVTVLVLGACPRWLTLADCHSDSDCETHKCGPDGVCLVPVAPKEIPCPECQAPQAGPFSVDGGLAWQAPHATLVPGTPVLLVDGSGATFRMTADGHLTQLGNVPGGILTTAAVVTAQGTRPPVVALRAWDGKLKLFSFPADALLEDLGQPVAGTSHQAAVVVSSGASAVLGAPDDNGQVVALTVGAGGDGGLAASIPVSTGGTVFAAVCKAPNLMALDGAEGLVLLRLAANPDGGPQVVARRVDFPVDPDAGTQPAPVFPPVMILESPSLLAVYTFRNLEDVTVVTRDSVVLADGGISAGPSVSTRLGQPMSGTAAGTLVEGEPWVAVPLRDGTLRLVRHEADGALTSERWQVPSPDGGAALGGVSAVRLRPEDTSATLFFGDANGDVRAVRDRVALPPSAGWPFKVEGRVSHAPLLLYFPGRSRLSMVVTAGMPGAPLVDIRLLGATYWEGSLVWPETHHDAENSSCLDLVTP